MNKEDFNNKVMQEIGLEVDSNGNVIDQDSRNLIQFKSKNIKCTNIGRDDIPFNPLENASLMSKLFSYYVDKLDKEDGRYVSVYYPNARDKGEKGYIELKEGTNVIKSGTYYNDSIKYAELMITLNGNTKVDFSELDSENIDTKRR